MPTPPQGSLGACTYDVCTEGEGSWPISDQMKGGCVDVILKRGRGTKIPRFKQVSFVHGPGNSSGIRHVENIFHETTKFPG